MKNSTFAASVLLFTVIAIHAAAQSHHPVIYGVTVNSSQQKLEIHGEHLKGDSATTVTFNGKVLPVLDTSGDSVTATLSPIPPGGSYLLKLSVGNCEGGTVTFAVTVPIVPATDAKAIRIFDAHDNLLGTLAGLSTTLQNGVTGSNGVIIFRNGYFISIEFSGKFPPASASSVSQILWTDSNCSGNGYLSTGSTNPNDSLIMGTNVVIYSNQTNSLYVATGGGHSVAASLSPMVQFLEGPLIADGYSVCHPLTAGRYMGWPLSPFDAATELGWELSGNPLGVAGPIRIQQ